MNEPKRRGPKRKLEIDAKCKICGKLATAIHYNCVSCEGCKGFFRRTVVHKKIYPECKLPTPCEIAVKGKRACQWCRYKKCIAQGMKAEMVTVTGDDMAGPPVKVETHENRLNINLMEKIKSEQGFVSPRVPTQVQEQLSSRFCMKNESFQKTQDHSQVQFSQQRASFEKAPLNPRIPSNQTSHRVKHDSRGSVSDDGSQTVSIKR